MKIKVVPSLLSLASYLFLDSVLKKEELNIEVRMKP